eukprot:2072275-Rhodomonas_salina.2
MHKGFTRLPSAHTPLCCAPRSAFAPFCPPLADHCCSARPGGIMRVTSAWHVTGREGGKEGGREGGEGGKEGEKKGVGCVTHHAAAD